MAAVEPRTLNEPGTGNLELGTWNLELGTGTRNGEPWLLRSPFITQRLAAGDVVSPGFKGAGRGDPMVLRLVRWDFVHRAWQVKNRLAPYGARVLRAHERAITGSEKELGIDEGAE